MQHYKEGTSAGNVLMHIMPAFMFTYLALQITSIYLKPGQIWKCFVLEFVTIIIPIVLVFTVLTEWAISVTLCALTAALIFHWIAFRRSKRNLTNADQVIKAPPGTISYITNSRSCINVMTGVAILAVDFNIFPGYLAKTRKYGFSLMDVGVGLFVYASGVVSPEIRGHKNSMSKAMRSVVPLLILGFARFTITSLLSYSVNVHEYGVHWNFFITLAVTKLLSSFMLSAINVDYIGVQGLALLSAHEIFIQMGLNKFVFFPRPRDNFLTANREGIISSLGYVSIHFLSVFFGKWLNVKNSDVSQNKNVYKLLLSIPVLYLLFEWCHYNFNISRCLANSTYCVWIMFLSIFVTTMFYFSGRIQAYVFSDKCAQVPIIFEAINYNGLIFFLFSNMLTGLVNILFETNSIDSVTSLSILFVYMFATCGLSVYLYVNKIKMKL